MEIKINKEIRNYTESLFFGLSARQFFFSVCACVVAIILYFILKPYFDIGTLSWMCILGAFPFAILGFVTYNGMYAEEIIKEPRANGGDREPYSGENPCFFRKR